MNKFWAFLFLRETYYHLNRDVVGRKELWIMSRGLEEQEMKEVTVIIVLYMYLKVCRRLPSYTGSRSTSKSQPLLLKSWHAKAFSGTQDLPCRSPYRGMAVEYDDHP